MPSTTPKLPLPQGQFFKWTILFHIAYVIVLLLGVVQALREPPTGIFPNSYLAALAVAAQFVGYVRFFLIMPRRYGWPIPLSSMATYFIINIALVCMAWLFHDELFWLLWPYMGQMFGLLAFQIALPMAAATLALLLLLINGIDTQTWTIQNLSGALTYWIFMSISGFYTYQLFRASQQRGKLIAELEETTQQLEEERDKNAELAVLRERARLARDMHDGLGHTLVGLSVQLEAIQRLYPVAPEKASAMIDALQETVRESMDSLRRTLSGLRAPGLGERELVTALRSLCHEFSERTGLQVKCTIGDYANQLPRPTAEALWRVAQESLNNIQKHADAQQVKLSLRFGAQRVILEIEDDGVGLSQEDMNRPARFGLKGMIERLEGLGGTLDIKSQLEQGPTIVASIPLVITPTPIFQTQNGHSAQHKAIPEK
ncbi:sensor histidine kinase [Chloroflexi bacterium TSY]|nr:sensor histidine kinase [Chloroflexi bacterium TSY]